MCACLCAIASHPAFIIDAETAEINDATDIFTMVTP